MGCAIQEAPTEQKITEMPPQQQKATVVEKKQQASGLKESHSTLLKLLESAPINNNSKNTNKETVPATTEEITAASAKKKVDSFKSHHHQHYRKRKELAPSTEAPSVIPTIKTENSSSSPSTIIVATKNPPPSPPTRDAPQDEPANQYWKKTRLAREWREKKLKEEQGGSQAQSQVAHDTDEDSLSECEHHRRESSDSSEYCQNDSGCDSDCPDNINELCKNFNEMKSEEDEGFFRRSIQQKIQYRPCTKNQQCSILRINRNRCQYCRLKKCIAVGMSRDAVRFGRVPKREKARILAAMQQSTQNRGHQRAMATELDDQPRLMQAVLQAHMETCEFTREKVQSMRQRARECPSYSMPTLACPLNPAPELQSEQEFSQRFAHVIRGVIDFAGMIPGFQLLTQDDKFTLLKAGLFDALFVRLICMFDSGINSIICLNGQVMRRDSIQNGANARFLVDSTFNFAERMNSMNLTDAEIGLFCAIVLITPDRPGLRNVELIDRMYSKLKQCLQTVISQNRPDKPDFMQELLKLMPDLRTLSTLHTEKLVVFRTEHKELLRQQMWQAEDEAAGKSPNWSSSCDASSEDVAKSPMGSVSSTESSDHTDSAVCGSSLSQSAPLLAATLSGGCPIRHRASSGSSAEDDIVGAAHLAQNGLTITPVVRSVPISMHRYRKLDSPTDSGIESGNEKHDHKLSSGSSSCSSPRSSLEDQQDDKRHIVEDMPVLKRVLQAPPLYDTNSLMDEAYKPHKKFRAMRQRGSEAEAAEVKRQPSPPGTTQALNTPPQHHQSQLHMHLTRPQTSSLSSTHSVLAKSLMEEPRMTPEQIKRSDIIQNYIMRGTESPVVNRDGLLVTVGQCPFTGNSRWQPQSVITRNQQTPSPSSSSYFQSPHSTSTSPPAPGPLSAAASPRLIELQVDIADPQQPLNLSKKSPTPPPQRSSVHKVLLEA